MNRCMYSSNYSNQMNATYGRPAQNYNSCRPTQYSDSCRQNCSSERSMQDHCSCTPHPHHHTDSFRQKPCRPSADSCKSVSNPDGCKPAQKPDCGRPAQKPDCGKPSQETACCKHEGCERPSYSRDQMLQYINEVSFAVNDILLYLDTHPCDCEAMNYYREHAAKRDAALCEYAKHYGPLTVDTAVKSEKDIWEWVMQPWPWEGGNC